MSLARGAADGRRDIQALAESLGARAAVGMRISPTAQRFLQSAVDRHGLSRAFEELPAIEHSRHPMVALCERLEGRHLRHVPIGSVRPDSAVLHGGGWSLTWVRWANGKEQIEAFRGQASGWCERISLTTDRQGWFGDYSQYNAGRMRERFEAWKVASSGEAFASLNARRIALVGDPPA